jgi:arylsulfatase A-like enzyme
MAEPVRRSRPAEDRARPASASTGWVITAHAVGAALLGLVETARLGSGALGLVLVPLFAATGLLAGAVIGAAGRLARGWPRWGAALVIAAPSLAVTIPIAQSLFDGPYARTLPLAPALPFVAPLVGWLLTAAATWLGGRLAAGDPTSRAIAILGVAGALGGLIRAQRAVLGTGYQDARVGAVLAALVLAGVFVRIALRPRLSPYIAAAVAAVVLGIGAAAISDGLAGTAERRLLADRGDQGRDLVRLWRGLLDLDRDGSSAALGGGDCDDRDAARHPGARDAPSDGIDQDCDGADAIAAAAGAGAAGGGGGAAGGAGGGGGGGAAGGAGAGAGAATATSAAAAEADFRGGPAYRALIERTRGMNVLVIAIDALRHDIVAPGAPHRDDFPRIARLMDEAIRFDRVIAPASATDVSVCTIVTGRHDPFQEIAVTLPEAMRALGRRTASVLPREVTRHVGEVLLERGIDHPLRIRTDGARADVGDRVTADATTAQGLAGIDAARAQGGGGSGGGGGGGGSGGGGGGGSAGPWYAWVHYFDVHEHHQIDVPAELLGAVDPGGSKKVHRYRALLRAIDGAIGRLLDELAARGEAERTIVWLVSDHGEALEGDPRMPATHGDVAYTPLVRVPLAVRIPGTAPGVRADPVTLVDITPTMLALAGDPAAMGPLDGFDLVPTILDGPAALRPPPKRAIVIHEVDQWSVVEWPYQVIVRPADDLVELYDIERDPLNLQDLSPRLPDLARRLRARYGEAPEVRVDRTWEGRAWREQRARRPPPRAPR